MEAPKISAAVEREIKSIAASDVKGQSKKNVDTWNEYEKLNNLIANILQGKLDKNSIEQDLNYVRGLQIEYETKYLPPKNYSVPGNPNFPPQQNGYGTPPQQNNFNGVNPFGGECAPDTTTGGENNTTETPATPPRQYKNTPPPPDDPTPTHEPDSPKEKIATKPAKPAKSAQKTKTTHPKAETPVPTIGNPKQEWREIVEKLKRKYGKK